MIRKIDGAEILRRVREHGVTVMCCAPAVVSAVLDARRVGGADPGPRPDAMIVAGAPPPTRTVARA